MQITFKNSEEEATIQLKTAWQFYCVNGAAGTMVMPHEIDAKTALIECRLNLGAKVVRVF